jgi:hypothetical protein
MDARLRSLITDYRAAVGRAILELRRGRIAMPISNVGWAIAKIPAEGTLPSGATYEKHGYGCKVSMAEGVVDFDFGDNGEINGFDAWRLWRYAEPRADKYGVTTHMTIREELQTLHALGQLVRESHGSLYYLADGI